MSTGRWSARAAGSLAWLGILPWLAEHNTVVEHQPRPSTDGRWDHLKHVPNAVTGLTWHGEWFWHDTVELLCKPLGHVVAAFGREAVPCGGVDKVGLVPAQEDDRVAGIGEVRRVEHMLRRCWCTIDIDERVADNDCSGASEVVAGHWRKTFEAGGVPEL